jgi:uncharacterized protein (TIGR03790 family)
MLRHFLRGAGSLIVAFCTVAELHAQSAENVAVVINQASPVSVQIGEHYVRKRAIPSVNVIRINAPLQEEIARAAFSATIEVPISVALTRTGLQDRILYLVLTKGVPLRVAGTSGLEGTVASVDSELTVLYRKMTGVQAPTRGRIDNPYYLGDRELREAQRFTHRAHDIFLVSRIDAFTADEAIAMIDRAQSPSSEGRIVLDQRATLGNATGDQWLEAAAGRLKELGFEERVLLENTKGPARGVKPVLGYYGSGSNDPANRVRRVEMGFVPGALAATFVSSDARTFQPPPDDWTPSDQWSDRSALFAGTPQSLVGDLIREGATGVAGHVAEPYLQSTVRPQILFSAYLSGFNLIESFYLAIPHLSWQTVVVGDPLCTPFPRKVLTRSDIEDQFDASTGTPGLFSKRRMEIAQRVAKGVPPKVLALSFLAETRLAMGDAAGARKALEQATDAMPSLTAAQLQLALLYEQAGDFTLAADRYRIVIKADPKNAVALNNLAYGLAVRQKMPQEARPLAQRAVAIAPNEPTLADTLAWIEYLLRNYGEAARLIAPAARALPGNAEVRLHAAFIFAAVKNVTAASAELKAALALSPDLAKREDVRELQAGLARAVAK